MVHCMLVKHPCNHFGTLCNFFFFFFLIDEGMRLGSGKIAFNSESDAKSGPGNRNFFMILCLNLTFLSHSFISQEINE